jgi:hypothetical protein
MKLLSSVRALLGFGLRRSRVEDEMEEELHSHLQIRADDLQRQGLSRAEAERQARVEFGGYKRYKEECREALGSRLLGELIADLRYGLRMAQYVAWCRRWTGIRPFMTLPPWNSGSRRPSHHSVSTRSCWAYSLAWRSC